MAEQWTCVRNQWINQYHILDEYGNHLATVEGREVAECVAALPQLVAALHAANRAVPVTSPVKLIVAEALKKAGETPSA